MPLYSLTYMSRVARSVRYEDAQEIAEASAQRNARIGVTGLLVYTPSHFIQVLEGPQAAVRTTFDRIMADPRHAEVSVLEQEYVPQRRFGPWHMRMTLMPRTLRADASGQLAGEAALAVLREATAAATADPGQ